MKKYLNKIINGECIEVMKDMPDNSVDLIITSPPYNKKNVGGKLVKKVKYKDYNDNIPEYDYQKLQIKFLNECFRISKVIFYNHKVRYDKRAIHPIEWILKTKWTLWQEIIWNRKITGNIRGWRCWNIDERVYWLVKEKPKELTQKLAQFTSIWDIRPERNNPHPAPFPEELAEKCIQIGSNEGDTVLDPMCGSGTTAVACQNLKRNFIGIEISKEYCDIANKRLRQKPLL